MEEKKSGFDQLCQPQQGGVDKEESKDQRTYLQMLSQIYVIRSRRSLMPPPRVERASCRTEISRCHGQHQERRLIRGRGQKRCTPSAPG
jgi:hypothetical protein